jgi:hypothetical protein
MNDAKKMVELSLEEYETQASSIAFDVMAKGNTFCVDTGDAGRFYIVREEKIAELVSELLQKSRESSAAALGL